VRRLGEHLDTKAAMTDHPELDEPDDAPLRSDQRRRILRVVALVSMALLVVPGFIGTVVQAQQSARYACEIARVSLAPGAQNSSARFELFPLVTAGWQCYAEFYDGTSIRIATLGPIPGLPRLRPVSVS
jgi:hypothetical protein